MHVWLFQANDEFIITESVLPQLGQVEDWFPKIHLKTMEAGDSVVLWQAAAGGLKPGVYGLAELDGKPYQYIDEEEYRVKIRYTRLLEHPVLKCDLLEHPLLCKLQILKMPFGANPFLVTEQEWVALEKLICQENVG